MKLFNKHIILLALFTLFANLATGVIDTHSEVILDGKWKFKVGDNPSWSSPDFDDSSWDEIKAPGNWESQGYRKYDGIAWYRKKVTPSKNFEGRTSVLELGFIDDVDEVFINGVKIGQTGKFPPGYKTGYKTYRKYHIPSQLIKFGEENSIAVRVYDATLFGGIVNGKLKILFKEGSLPLDIDLAGEWFFNTGKNVDINKRTPIYVPGLWENQGFYNYDGYAVYSNTFKIPEGLKSKRLVFMVGRIDDVDRVYINGKLVGATGKYDQRVGEDYHLEFRNYFIPEGIVKQGQINTIEIKVWDERWDGGIVEGPIGIVAQDKFREYWMGKRRY